ncbi:hypothetical protein VPH35_008661 [Triticum aestivum]
MRHAHPLPHCITRRAAVHSPREPHCINTPHRRGSRVSPPPDPDSCTTPTPPAAPTPLALSLFSGATTTPSSPTRSLLSPPCLLRLASAARSSFSSCWSATCSLEAFNFAGGEGREEVRRRSAVLPTAKCSSTSGDLQFCPCCRRILTLHMGVQYW